MIDGLIYHHSNYIKAMYSLYPFTTETYSNKLKVEKNGMLYKVMRHETIAYLNRLGQFYYFAKSQKSIMICDLMPTIIKFIPLRMKGTAHRALDAPRTNDVEEFSIQLDNLMHGSSKLYFKGRFILQLRLSNGEFLHFGIIEEHDKIIFEAKELIRLLELHTKQQ